MRELKFRAWDAENKKFAFVGFDILGEVTVFDMVRGYELEKLVKLEITQFTGLKDRNGKDIYEGDILATWNDNPEFDLWDKGNFGYTIVQWDDGRSCFMGSDWTWQCGEGGSVYDLVLCEIVGNIYENPELLT